MKKYDFIKCKECGKPLNKMIYGNLSVNAELPKHSCVAGCCITDYKYECSGCGKRYKLKDVFVTIPGLFKPHTVCLKKGFKKGYDSDFDEVAKSKQLQREEKIEKISKEISKLNVGTKFNFNDYFDKYDVPERERFYYYLDIIDNLDGLLSKENEYNDKIIGLPYNIPHIKK